MSLAEPPVKALTAEDLLDMPDDGVTREIVAGELREESMTRRNHAHSGTEAVIAMILGLWNRQRPQPRGRVHSGEVGFRLSRDPETFVGVDVAFVSAELVAVTHPRAAFFDGAPALAVEILSPSDRFGNVWEKVGIYLDAGCVVWVVDPVFRTVSVHRPGRPVELYNETQELPGDPELPGFRARVAEFFE